MNLSSQRIETAYSYDPDTSDMTAGLKRGHPGPINRGVALASDGPNSSILRQVSNGLAIRMAVLFLFNQTSRAEPGAGSKPRCGSL